MTNEYSVNLDETSTARKIKLVVTDSDPDVDPDVSQDTGSESVGKSVGQANAAPSQQSPAQVQPTIQTDSISQDITDPDKVMRDLPVDEFFRVLEQSTPEQLQTLIQTFEKGARTKGGSKLLQKVIEVPQEPRSIISILVWWEWRRPLYNVALCLAGLPSILILTLFGITPLATLTCALCYMVFANICYTLGTPAEVVARACWKEKAANYGPVLLTLGTIFSVLLTIVLEVLVIAVVAINSIGH